MTGTEGATVDTPAAFLTGISQVKGPYPGKSLESPRTFSNLRKAGAEGATTLQLEKASRLKLSGFLRGHVL